MNRSHLLHILAWFMCGLVMYSCGSSQSATAANYLGLYTTNAGGGVTMAGDYSGGLCSRTSGRAPLLVLFNTVGTTSANITPVGTQDATSAGFHQIYYAWNFADAGSGTWTYGSGGGANSRNAAYGPVAAHVFATAGTYNVTVTAFDGASTISNYAACTVTVYSPTDATHGYTSIYCFGQSTTPVAGVDGCPAGATGVNQSNMATAISTYQGSNVQMLFKHDDTFTGTSTLSCSNCEVNMYGTGAKPILSGGGFNIGVNSGNQDDVRIAEIDLEGPTNNAFNAYNNDNTTPGALTNVLIYQNKAQNCNNSANGDGSAVQAWVAYSPIKQFGVVDNYFNACGHMNNSSTGGEGIFIAAEGIAVMGNYYHGNGSLQQNLGRFGWAYESTINNNYWDNGASNKAMVQIRSPGDPTDVDIHQGTNLHSQYDVMSDEQYVATNGVSATGIVPGTPGGNEQPIDGIVERQLISITVGGTISGHIDMQGLRMTVRNNVLISTNSTVGRSIAIQSLGTPNTPATQDAWVYNNTDYRSDSCSGYHIVSFDTGGTGSLISRNNLAYWPSCTSSAVNEGGATYTADHNTGNVSAYTTCPKWSGDTTCTSTPSTIAGVKIDATSAYAGTGVKVPSWYDAANVAEQNPPDIGAVRH